MGVVSAVLRTWENVLMGRWTVWSSARTSARSSATPIGNDLERAPAVFADERIGLIDLGHEPRPAWGAAALLGLLLPVLLASQLLGGPLAAYAVGVVAIEVGAMFARVGDMVGQTRPPLLPGPRRATISPRAHPRSAFEGSLRAVRGGPEHGRGLAERRSPAAAGAAVSRAGAAAG